MLKTIIKITLISIGISLFSSCATENKSRVDSLPFYQEASFTPIWKSTSELSSNFHSIPDFSLTNQNGKKITNHSFDNKIYVADFFFTECSGICPKMTTNMSLIQKAFEKDEEILLISHSVTPHKDSVPVLKNYADLYSVDSNKWHLVTGERKEIYDLGRNSYFVEEDMGVGLNVDDFLHTENFVLIDKNKHIRGIYNGLNISSVNQLIEDIKTLKKEIN